MGGTLSPVYALLMSLLLSSFRFFFLNCFTRVFAGDFASNIAAYLGISPSASRPHFVEPIRNLPIFLPGNRPNGVQVVISGNNSFGEQRSLFLL